MTKADQTSLFPAGTFHLVELEVINHLVIKILRKNVAIFKEYDMLGEGEDAQ